MTTIEVTLPDQLAQEAKEAGLLSPEPLEAMVREELRKRSVDRLFAIMERARPEDVPLTPEEIAEEVRAARAELQCQETR